VLLKDARKPLVEPVVGREAVAMFGVDHEP
jgi:hypothetical protein